MLDWQVRTAFAAGCAGAFVFAWTDEWHSYLSGGDAGRIEDWDFGLTRPRPPSRSPRSRRCASAFADAPFGPARRWPRVSVVVCTYNGARTLPRLPATGSQRLDYPDYEVIVVDDGSTDATAAIAREYGVRLI